MTTAREQAREAAEALPSYATPEMCADATSDVWEPLLQKAEKERDLLRKALICADHVDWGLSRAEADEVRRILGNGVI